MNTSLLENFQKKYIIKDEYMPVVLAFFWSSVAFAFVTFPFSFYSYIRCLSDNSFKGSYIYRLITLNGIAVNFIQYLAYMLTNQMGTLSNMNGYFNFLTEHKLVVISKCTKDQVYNQGQLCQFSLLFSSSAQSTFNMLISLNRLLAIVRNNQLKNHDRKFFIVTCLFAAAIPILVSIPAFSANCIFLPIISTTGQTHYIAFVIERTRTALGFFYFVVGGIIANVLSAILVYQFVKTDIERSFIFILATDISDLPGFSLSSFHHFVVVCFLCVAYKLILP